MASVRNHDIGLRSVVRSNASSCPGHPGLEDDGLVTILETGFLLHSCAVCAVTSSSLSSPLASSFCRCCLSSRAK